MLEGMRYMKKEMALKGSPLGGLEIPTLAECDQLQAANFS